MQAVIRIEGPGRYRSIAPGRSLTAFYEKLHGFRCTPDWIIQPDPPTNTQDMDVTYSGSDPDITEVVYYTDDEEPVRVDISQKASFTIPASALKGKSFVKLIAPGGGEDGIRIVRFKAP